jgi:WD40 repeat protein
LQPGPSEEAQAGHLQLDPSQERRFEEVLAGYLQAAEAGQAPDPTELTARHPDLASALESFFANHQQFQQLARLLPPTEPPEAKEEWIEPATADRGLNHPAQSAAEAVSAPGVRGLPRLFGDYELLEEIARGGMGVVYKARQISLDRTVALKMLLDQELASLKDVKRFQTEAEAAVGLDHPNIVPLYQVGEHEGQHYFTMRLIDGGSLARRLADYAKGKEAAQLLCKVARAVHYAHQRGILHRDLKPGNILLDADGKPYVTDFGLAKRVQGELGLTLPGAIIGTPSYMPPEQARAENGLTTAVDVYGLGAILYELLTGRPPFEGPTPLDTLIHVLEKEPQPPRKGNRRVDRDLEAICLKCLHKDPQRRYDSADALAEDLERWQAHKPIRARRTGLLGRAVKWARRRPVAAALVALLALAPLLGWGFKAWQSWNAQHQVESYFQLIRQAQDALAENQRDRADQLLDQCASDLRAWEWHCLKRMCHEEPLGLTPIPQIRGPIERVAFSQDGQRLVGATDPRSMDIQVCDLATGQRYSRRHEDVKVTSLALSLDGKRLALAVAASQRRVPVQIWKGGIQERVVRDRWGRVLVDRWGRVYTVRERAMVPEVEMRDQSFPAIVEVWDLQSPFKQASCTIKVEAKCLTFNPNGTQLALVQGEKLTLFEAGTGKEIRTLSKPSGTVHALEFGPGGKALAVAGAGGWVQLRDVASDREIRSFQINGGEFTRLQFSPDGEQLAAASKGGALTVWDIPTGRQSFTVYGASGPMGYSPDGRRLVWASKEGGVRVSDVQTGRQVCVLPGLTDQVKGLVVCPDSRLFLAVVNHSKVTVKVYDAGPLDERPPRAAPKPDK